jgi:hypothetical protein
MGRPLKKVNFGAVATAGAQIRVRAFFTGDLSTTAGCHIVKQKGSKRFLISNAAGNKEEVLTLVPRLPAAAGECGIVLRTPDSAGDVWVSKITKNLVTGSDGNAYRWGYVMINTDQALVDGVTDTGIAEIDHA